MSGVKNYKQSAKEKHIFCSLLLFIFQPGNSSTYTYVMNLFTYLFLYHAVEAATYLLSSNVLGTEILLPEPNIHGVCIWDKPNAKSFHVEVGPLLG